MDLLQRGSEKALSELIATNSKAIRPLLGRLYDPDETIRVRASRAVGHAASVHPELGVELIRRLMWALNDESGTNGGYGLAALGEIGRQCPERLAPYLSALASMAWDDGLRPDLLRALGAVAESAPEMVEPYLDEIERYVVDGRTTERETFRRLVSRCRGENCEH